MNKALSILAAAIITISSCSGPDKGKAWNDSDRELASAILNDHTLSVVDSMGYALLKKGYNAGSGYNQTWIRDFNTFIETVLKVADPADVRKALLTFFLMQQPNGEIVDGYVLKEDFNWSDESTYTSPNAPGYIGFKNTVETDQETSLIQAVRKYIDITGDKDILSEDLAGETALDRLKDAVNYLMREKYDPETGLLTGALTSDWGDVENDPVWYSVFA